MHQLFSRAPLPAHYSQYLPDTHKFMKTLLRYHGSGIIVEVRIQAKMDYDDKDLTDFQFGSSQESKIDPPLVFDSVWDCPGITLDTIKDDDGKTILGWRCGYALFPAIKVVLDSSSIVMHIRLCCTLQRGRTLSPVPACSAFLQMLSMP
jgi:hypothetical protein